MTPGDTFDIKLTPNQYQMCHLVCICSHLGGWPVDRLDGRLAGWLAGWLADWLTGRLPLDVPGTLDVPGMSPG